MANRALVTNDFADLKNDFKDTKCLNLCELHLILGDQSRSNRKRSAEAQALIRTSLEYTARFAKLTSRNAVVEIRNNLEREGDLQPYEIPMLVDLLPKSSFEAKALIPSLSRLSNERLSRILLQLEQHRAHAR